MNRTAALESTAIREPGASQLLTFQLGNNVYGVDILQVREIRGIGPIAVLPGAPAYLRGVMNLRGAVVPVIDLRKRLGLPEIEISRFAVIIVVRIEDKSVGLLADAVNEVLTVPPERLEPPPSLTVRQEQHFIAGFALRAESAGDEDFIIVLSLERLHDANIDETLGLPEIAAGEFAPQQPPTEEEPDATRQNRTPEIL